MWEKERERESESEHPCSSSSETTLTDLIPTLSALERHTPDRTLPFASNTSVNMSHCDQIAIAPIRLSARSTSTLDQSLLPSLLEPSPSSLLQSTLSGRGLGLNSAHTVLLNAEQTGRQQDTDSPAKLAVENPPLDP